MKLDNGTISDETKECPNEIAENPDELVHDLRKNEAARIIQCYFRGWLIRNNLKIVTRCAIRIQAFWRGWKIRSKYCPNHIQQHKNVLELDCLNKIMNELGDTKEDQHQSVLKECEVIQENVQVNTNIGNELGMG